MQARARDVGGARGDHDRRRVRAAAVPDRRRRARRRSLCRSSRADSSTPRLPPIAATSRASRTLIMAFRAPAGAIAAIVVAGARHVRGRSARRVVDRRHRPARRPAPRTIDVARRSSHLRDGDPRVAADVVRAVLTRCSSGVAVGRRVRGELAGVRAEHAAAPRSTARLARAARLRARDDGLRARDRAAAVGRVVATPRGRTSSGPRRARRSRGATRRTEAGAYAVGRARRSQRGSTSAPSTSTALTRAAAARGGTIEHALDGVLVALHHAPRPCRRGDCAPNRRHRSRARRRPSRTR